MGASEKAAATYHPGDVSPVLVQAMTADIRAAVARQMLPPAALAEELVRRGWRPVVDNEAFFMGAGDPEADYSGDRGPTPGRPS